MKLKFNKNITDKYNKNIKYEKGKEYDFENERANELLNDPRKLVTIVTIKKSKKDKEIVSEETPEVTE